MDALPSIHAQPVIFGDVMYFFDSHGLQGQRPGNKPAQGNALGILRKKAKALKGRNTLSRPFRAFSFLNRATQGVALGWLVSAPLVLVPGTLRSA
jgi:hypothetical protein